MTDPLTEFFYLTFQLFYLIGFVTCFMGFPLFVLFWKRWMPIPARTLFWAKRRGTPPILLVHDSGRGELTTVIERRGEGIVKTRENKYKILPRVRKKTFTEDEEKEESATSAITIELLKKKYILDYSDWVLKRCQLVGLNMPFFVGYTGKLCLLNPEALALYEMGALYVRTEDEIMFNPKGLCVCGHPKSEHGELEGVEGKGACTECDAKDEDYCEKYEEKNIEDALEPLLLLEPRKIQQIIYTGFDQSQIAGIVADTEDLMRIGRGFSPKILGAIMILVVVGLIGAAMFLAPQLFQGM